MKSRQTVFIRISFIIILRKIIDLGCGEGYFQSHFAPLNYLKKIQSFDLVATKDFIRVCDISKLPLKKDT